MSMSRSRVYAPSSLPNELWFQVIQQLPSHDQRACLSVSKLLHDISQQFVFSHTIIRFGLWRKTKPNEDWTDEQKAKTDYATRLSIELLKHIINSQKLARVVTKVTVRAYTPTGQSHSAELMDALVEALKLLHLHAFAWDGCRPEPQEQAIHAVCETSRTSLSELLLPPHIPETLSSSLSLINQFQLQSLSFHLRHTYPLPHDYDVDRFTPMAKTAEANAPSLRTLRLSGSELVEALNVAPFTALVELDLLRLDPVNIVHMRAVFQRCPQLQSLSLSLDADGHTDGEIEGLFRHAPKDALPNLTAFKFHACYAREDEIKAIAKFLKRRTRLERLDFLNPGGGDSYGLGFGFDGDRDLDLDGAPILKILKHLPCLAVLGCDVRIDKLTTKRLARLGRWVPPSVIALALTVAARKCVAPERAWAQFFEGRGALRYLHVILDPETKHGDIKIDLRDVAARHAPASLELFGYEDTLSWVSPSTRDLASAATSGVDTNVHNTRTGTGAGAGAWPAARVHFRTADDFRGEEGWEWLLHYRELPVRCWKCSGEDDNAGGGDLGLDLDLDASGEIWRDEGLASGASDAGEEV